MVGAAPSKSQLSCFATLQLLVLNLCNYLHSAQLPTSAPLFWAHSDNLLLPPKDQTPIR